MKKKKPSVVSLGEISRVAGISRAAAGYAMRNSPGVSPATRERVQAIARRLGYVPDARMAAIMAGVRGTKSKDLQPLAWLNTSEEEDAWHRYKFMSPYLEGARERARALGYRLDEIWTHEAGMTMSRISKILYHRGIEGVIVTHSARHVRLDWDRLAAVSLEGSLLAPRLQHVVRDSHYNLLLALKMLKRSGYRRIGICLENEFNRHSHRSLMAAAHHFHLAVPNPDRIPPLFYAREEPTGRPGSNKQISRWLSRYRPDAVVGHSNCLVSCVEAAGYRVPEEIGIVHLGTDDDVSDWAGICSHRRKVGILAAELVVSLIHNRQFGVPDVAVSTVVRGTWHPGRTLLIPKPG
ncbi:MAG: LacI family DNA-binding transcriptional regulator [Terrimicrobiaceae bacterium]